MSETAHNVTPLRAEGNDRRVERAKYVHGLLTDERWSIRQAALKLGMNHTVLGSRLNGSTAFLADELEDIAKLLRLDPVAFYADYLKVGPTGIEPMTSTVEYGRFSDSGTDAIVTPIWRSVG